MRTNTETYEEEKSRSPSDLSFNKGNEIVYQGLPLPPQIDNNQKLTSLLVDLYFKYRWQFVVDLY